MEGEDLEREVERLTAERDSWQRVHRRELERNHALVEALRKCAPVCPAARETLAAEAEWRRITASEPAQGQVVQTRSDSE